MYTMCDSEIPQKLTLKVRNPTTNWNQATSCKHEIYHERIMLNIDLESEIHTVIEFRIHDSLGSPYMN